VEHIDDRLAAMGEDLRDAVVRLEEAAHALHAYVAAFEHDPVRLDAVEGRLERLEDLARRHGSLEEALAAAAAAAEHLDRLGRGDEERAAAAAREADAEAAARAAAEELRAARRSRRAASGAAVEAHLADLGMGDARVVVPVVDRDLGPTGADDVQLLVAPNPGSEAAPVARVASGGELSRLTLAIRLAGHDDETVRTLVFDEVDAGVGGRTARSVADKLSELSRRTQVVCITHLPQIAARADRHFQVVKEPGDPTVTRIEQLAGAAIDEELARMLGAEVGSEEALQLARSLRAGA
jgi:DNA repair protein RecN (Recombination protein N)